MTPFTSTMAVCLPLPLTSARLSVEREHHEEREVGEEQQLEEDAPEARPSAP